MKLEISCSTSPTDVGEAEKIELSPLLDPPIEHVVQKDVRKERTDDPALWRSFVHFVKLPFLHHASLQPLHQEAHEALVPDPISSSFFIHA